MNPKVKLGLLLIAVSIIGEFGNIVGNVTYDGNEELNDYFRAKNTIYYGYYE